VQPQSVSATALTSVAFIVDPSGLSVGLIRKRLCPCDALKTSASGAEPQWRMPEHQDNPGCPRGWDIVPPPHSATSPPDRLHSVTNPFLAQVQSAVSSQQAAGSRQQAAGSRQQAEQSRAEPEPEPEPDDRCSRRRLTPLRTSIGRCEFPIICLNSWYTGTLRRM